MLFLDMVTEVTEKKYTSHAHTGARIHAHAHAHARRARTPTRGVCVVKNSVTSVTDDLKRNENSMLAVTDWL